MLTRISSAHWQGDLPTGNGTLEFGSGAYEGAYTAASRFDNAQGTNPEELIAAAHAGCFSMALSNNLAQDGFTPTSVDTKATVYLEKTDAGFTITRINLVTVGVVPGIDEADFLKHVESTKSTCPVSRALAAVSEINVEATLA